jgi:hypothetical protein
MRILFILTGFTVFFSVLSAMPTPAAPSVPVRDTAVVSAPAAAKAALYESLNLDSLELSRSAFDAALKGYYKLVGEGAILRDNVLSIVDFSLPSSKKRLFVLDLETGSLLFNTYVSHGRNSGLDRATRFSNAVNSFKSSLGFYITGNTYKGQHGYSLKLLGVEKGINDKAFERGIVIHAADYVNEKLAATRGYIGRSLGCPALPVKLYKPIIREIKDGSCLFVYAPDTTYTTSSTVLGNGRA